MHATKKPPSGGLFSRQAKCNGAVVISKTYGRISALATVPRRERHGRSCDAMIQRRRGARRDFGHDNVGRKKTLNKFDDP
jgi:hypothetical protein